MPEKTALQTAQQFQIDASKTGFEWDHIDQLFEKLQEEIEELRQGIKNNDIPNIEEELGDMLFVVTNLAKNLGCDAETSLRNANTKFERRYNGMFDLFRTTYPNKASSELTLEQWDELWEQQKKKERQQKSI